MKRIISVEDVSVETNNYVRLKSTSVDIDNGLTCITGPSGSGKSTFVKAMAGITKISTGKIAHYPDTTENPHYILPEKSANIGRRALNWVRLESSAEASAAKYRSKQQGYVAQQPNIPIGLTAGEYLVKPHLARGNNLDSSYVDMLTQRLEIDKLLGKRAFEMSGGELQRVTIAFALAHKPNILFADEPTAALDTASTEFTMGLLKDLASEHAVSIVCVTHNPAVTAFADRQIQMRDSAVVSVV